MNFGMENTQNPSENRPVEAKPAEARAAEARPVESKKEPHPDPQLDAE